MCSAGCVRHGASRALDSRGKAKRTWSFENNILNAWAMSVVLFATLIGIFGWEVAPWLLLQAVAGFTFLEAANYLEHYGLLRGKRADGLVRSRQPR